jgi:hypothetical protein
MREQQDPIGMVTAISYICGSHYEGAYILRSLDKHQQLVSYAKSVSSKIALILSGAIF